MTNKSTKMLLNYEELLEDMDIIESKELKKAETELEKGKIYRWEDIKRTFNKKEVYK
jgi:hypothetical protein